VTDQFLSGSIRVNLVMPSDAIERCDAPASSRLARTIRLRLGRRSAGLIAMALKSGLRRRRSSRSGAGRRYGYFPKRAGEIASEPASGSRKPRGRCSSASRSISGARPRRRTIRSFAPSLRPERSQRRRSGTFPQVEENRHRGRRIQKRQIFHGFFLENCPKNSHLSDSIVEKWIKTWEISH
jgi:hypothetical protein